MFSRNPEKLIKQFRQFRCYKIKNPTVRVTKPQYSRKDLELVSGGPGSRIEMVDDVPEIPRYPVLGKSWLIYEIDADANEGDLICKRGV